MVVMENVRVSVYFQHDRRLLPLAPHPATGGVFAPVLRDEAGPLEPFSFPCSEPRAEWNPDISGARADSRRSMSYASRLTPRTKARVALAPAGRRTIAQGASPGFAGHTLFPSPGGAAERTVFRPPGANRDKQRSSLCAGHPDEGNQHE